MGRCLAQDAVLLIQREHLLVRTVSQFVEVFHCALAEKALLGAGFPRVYLFRPAYIYPVRPRKELKFGYHL
jgi:hypothetical protein